MIMAVNIFIIIIIITRSYAALRAADLGQSLWIEKVLIFRYERGVTTDILDV